MSRMTKIRMIVRNDIFNGQFGRTAYLIVPSLEIASGRKEHPALEMTLKCHLSYPLSETRG